MPPGGPSARGARGAGAPVRRRVRANAATANTARFDAAIAARDVDATRRPHRRRLRGVHHPTGLTYDRDAALDRLRDPVQGEEPTFAQEPLATLGDALALCRRSDVVERVRRARRFDVGPWRTSTSY